MITRGAPSYKIQPVALYFFLRHELDSYITTLFDIDAQLTTLHLDFSVTDLMPNCTSKHFGAGVLCEAHIGTRTMQCKAGHFKYN